MQRLLHRLSGCQERFLEPGDFLFRQFDRAKHIFYVKKGRVKLTRFTIEGYAVTLNIARAGDTLAEGAITSERYHCNAIADIASQILCIPKQEFLDLITCEPDMAREFISILSAELRRLRTILEIRNIRSAKSRVIQYLLLQVDPESHAIHLDRRLKEIATEIGLAHETLYRTLALLEREGYISRTAGMIKINHKILPYDSNHISTP